MVLRRVLSFLGVSTASFLISTLALDLGSATLHASTLRAPIARIADTAFSILLSAPGNGAIVSGSVALQAYATDVGAASLQFVVNNTNVGAPITGGSCAENWDTTQWADGSYSVMAIATDDSGNETTSPAVAVTVINTPLQIFNVGTSSITTSSALITWNTNQPAEGLADYGTTPSYGTSTTFETSLATSHSMTLSGLSPATTYHFDIRSWNAVGGPGQAGDFEFMTASTSAPPSTPPSTPPPSTPSNTSGSTTSNTTTSNTTTSGTTTSTPPASNTATTTPPVTTSSTPTVTPNTGGCTTPDPFMSIGGGNCVNGGWSPKGDTPTTTTSNVSTPVTNTVVTSSSSTGCVGGDPFTSIGGGTCINGGWLPALIAASLGLTSNSTSTPAPTTQTSNTSTTTTSSSTSTVGCSTPNPFMSIGGGTCVNGGWLPKGDVPTTSSSSSTSQTTSTSSTGCSTPDPFTSIGGGKCVNGGWTPKIGGELSPAPQAPLIADDGVEASNASLDDRGETGRRFSRL